MTERVPDCTSDELERTIDELTVDQVRFVVARQEFSTDKEAAESVGLHAQTVKRWKGDGVPLDRAVKLMASDGVVVALKMRRRSLAKAMLVKVAGLDSDNERVRQGVATEIAEWELGKATQPTDNTHDIKRAGVLEEMLREIREAGPSADVGDGG